MGRERCPLLHYFSTIPEWLVVNVHYIVIGREITALTAAHSFITSLLSLFSVIFSIFRSRSRSSIGRRPSGTTGTRPCQLFFRSTDPSFSGKKSKQMPEKFGQDDLLFGFLSTSTLLFDEGSSWNRKSTEESLLSGPPMTNIGTSERKGSIIG